MAVRVIRVVMAFGHILVLCWVSRLFNLVHVFFQAVPVPAFISKNVFSGIDLISVWTCPSPAVDESRTPGTIAGPDDLNPLVDLGAGLIGMVNGAAKDLTICVQVVDDGTVFRPIGSVLNHQNVELGRMVEKLGSDRETRETSSGDYIVVCLIFYLLRVANDVCSLWCNPAAWRILERDLKGLKECSGREDQLK
jgi:hypothetical protein